MKRFIIILAAALSLGSMLALPAQATSGSEIQMVTVYADTEEASVAQANSILADGLNASPPIYLCVISAFKPYLTQDDRIRFGGIISCNIKVTRLNMRLHGFWGYSQDWSNAHDYTASDPWTCGPCQTLGPHTFTEWPRGDYLWTYAVGSCPQCVPHEKVTHSQPCRYIGFECS